jgi:hypothetical protein
VQINVVVQAAWYRIKLLFEVQRYSQIARMCKRDDHDTSRRHDINYIAVSFKQSRAADELSQQNKGATEN